MMEQLWKSHDRRDIDMNNLTPTEMFSKLDDLSEQEQAVCVLEAAKACLPIWQAFEREHGFGNLGTTTIDAFEGWRQGNVTALELKARSQVLYEKLPQDIEGEPDPQPGFAGWAIYDIVVIALGEFPDVRDSIMRT